MKYHERMELYKQGKLEGEQREQVEYDIERHEALSEYLFEKEEEYGPDDSPEEAGRIEDVGEDVLDRADEFTRKINRAVRKAFLRMGIIVGSVIFVLMLAIVFVLPRVVDLFYYDPGKKAGRGEYFETNQMSLDMAVYTELAIPGEYRYNVLVTEKGYGNYEIIIGQTVSYSGKFHNLAGRVEKGVLKLYDINYLQPPAGNVFGWFQMEPGQGETLQENAARAQGTFVPASGDQEGSLEHLNELEEGKTYQAYVTLDTIMDYEKFIEFIDSQGLSGIWCAPRLSEDFTSCSMNLGFYLDPGQGFSMEWDREKYPDLVLWGDEQEINMDVKLAIVREEASAAEHFGVMLNYMADQEQFLEMMGQVPDRYREAAEYVEENGLTVYGFACRADKETLQNMHQMREVYSIYTQELD